MSIPSDNLPAEMSDVAFHYYRVKGSIETFDLAIQNNAVRSRAIHFKKVFCYIKSGCISIYNTIKSVFSNFVKIKEAIIEHGCTSRTYKIVIYRFSNLVLLHPMRFACQALTMILRVGCSAVGVIFPNLMLPGLKYIEYITLANLKIKMLFKDNMVTGEYAREGREMHPGAPSVYFELNYSRVLRVSSVEHQNEVVNRLITPAYTKVGKLLESIEDIFEQNQSIFINDAFLKNLKEKITCEDCQDKLLKSLKKEDSEYLWYNLFPSNGKDSQVSVEEQGAARDKSGWNEWSDRERVFIPTNQFRNYYNDQYGIHLINFNMFLDVIDFRPDNVDIGAPAYAALSKLSSELKALVEKTSNYVYYKPRKFKTVPVKNAKLFQEWPGNMFDWAKQK